MFNEQPFQDKIPNEIPFNKEEWSIVDQEVQELLRKGAIVPCESESGEFISTIFIVPKPNGKFRPVINLKYLNEFIQYDHFKQETFSTVLDLLQKGDYMTSIDLQDAYFAVPVQKDSQKYLKFSWNGVLYKFVCVCFGIKSAPFLFTKLLKPVYARFREQKIRCFYYIDDSLNMDKEMAVCQSNTKMMLHSLESLGYTVNYKKSVLVPTQRIIFFGFILDSVQFKIFLTEEKVQKIKTKAQSLLNTGLVVVREVASFIGLIINAFHAVLEAPMYYRSLERDKIVGLGENHDFDNMVILSDNSTKELNWWKHNVAIKNGKRVRPEKVQLRCRTDASLQGWGSIDLNSDMHANGRWTIQESKHSINFLELLAVFYALQALYWNKNNVHIEIQCDNVSAVSYLNCMGGMTSKSMDALAKDIWSWCLDKEIFISAVHLPGILNSADFYSRNFSDSTEWMVKKDIFQRLCSQFFQPDIDLFASRLNRQLEVFCSWFPEPGAIHYDALSMSWQNYTPYIFPPFSLLSKVINKIVDDQVEKAILVFPVWKSQSWYPLLLDNICSFPVRLPRHKDLLTLAHNGDVHPLHRSLRIAAVTVSGRRCKVEDFQQELCRLYSTHGHKVPESSTSTPGTSGMCGTIYGMEIPFKRLRLLSFST